MIKRYPKTLDPDGPGGGKEITEKHLDAGSDDACRCKATSKMTPRELLGLMFSDLTFWKKEKKK